VWREAGTTATPVAFELNFVAALGARLYFASASNNNRGTPQYIKSFDTVDGRFRDEPVANNDLCACGLEGKLLGASGRLHYFGGSARSWAPGETAWRDLDYPEPAQLGTLTMAASGSRIFALGGRETLQAVVAFDVGSGRWQLDGLSAVPERIYSSCVGAVDGKIYVFGGSGVFATADPHLVQVYDLRNNAWSELPRALSSGYCWGQTAPTWHGQLVVLDDRGGITTFDPRTPRWSKSFALPMTERDNAAVAVVPDDGHLYLVATDSYVGDHATIWKLSLE
jgi:hypothetical protein